MNKFLTMGFVLLALALRVSAQGYEMATNTIDLGGHGQCEMIVPKDWVFVKTQPTTNVPPTIQIVSVKEAVTIQIALFWDGIGQNLSPTEEQMEKLVTQNVAKQYLKKSIEKKVAVEKLKGKEAVGTFARVTDARYGMRNPPPREYRNVAPGMVRTGNIWAKFTIFTNEKDGPSFRRGLAVIESMRKL